MPILKPTSEPEAPLRQFRIRLKANLCEEIEAYANWVGLSSINDFLEKASYHVLENDKEWLQVKNNHKLYMKQIFQPVVKFAEESNAKSIIQHDEKPRLVIHKPINREQKDKFLRLEKMLEQSKPIEDARIFLNLVCDLFSGDFDISYSGTCIFLYNSGADQHDDSTMVACVYPY